MTKNPLAIEPIQRDEPSLSICIESDQASNADEIDDAYIRADSFQAEESVSQPFHFTIECRADDTSASGRRLKTLDSTAIGKWVRIRIKQPRNSKQITSPSSAQAYEERFFRGMITELNMGAPGNYTLTLSSPLQLFNSRNRYFIYSHSNISDLLQTLFQHDLLDNRFKLSLDFDLSNDETLTRKQDWIQTGESDMDFLQRVLGKTAIYYFFVHDKDCLTLVFTDRPVARNGAAGAYQHDVPASDYPLPLRYAYTSLKALSLSQIDVFGDLRYSVKIVPGFVRSMLTRTEAEWESSNVATFTSFDAASKKSNAAAQFQRLSQDPSEDISTPGYQHHLYYDYGVNQTEAQQQLTRICQQIQTSAGTLTGTVASASLSPGYTFQLTVGLSRDENGALVFSNDKGFEGEVRPEFEDQIFVVTKIKHSMSSSGTYTGEVEATSVSSDAAESEQTLLSPFSMQHTQQGSVLAHVIEHNRPEGWRYRSKENFQSAKNQSEFGVSSSRESYTETGCMVRLVTGQEHWVSLSRPTQTVPEVGAMVTIGRGSNASEQPELQQVLASHGSKSIQPPGRRRASWQANTSWGSNYSTSYGDAISIHYSHQSPTSADDLKTAIRFVEGAYDQTGVADSLYGNCSYSRGGNWSMSLSDNSEHPDQGVLSASISQGSSYNESHTYVSYGISHTGTSQSFSKTGKSVSRSVTGEYEADINQEQPSFIDGFLPEQSIVDIADSLSMGDSYSENHTKGKSINLSGSGVAPPSYDDTSATVYSNSKTVGKVVNKSATIGNTENFQTVTGNQSSVSTTNGNHSNTSTVTGNSQSTSKTTGNSSTNNTTIGATSNVDTFVGAKSNVSTQLGATSGVDTFTGVRSNLSTQIGATSNIDTFIGARSNISTQLSASSNISTTLGASTTTDTYLGVKNTTSTQLATSNNTSTSIGATNSTESFIGAKNSTVTQLAATNSTNTTMGISNSTDTFMGLKNSTSNNLSISNETLTGSVANVSDLRIKTKTAEMETQIVVSMIIIM